MRVGVDFHFLSQGHHLVGRGVGRYTQQQLGAVLSIDTANQYVLVCTAGADLSLIAPEIRDADNVRIRRYAPAGQPTGDDPGTVLERAEHYQAWLARQGIDVFHATAPLMLDGPDLARLDTCPTVATLYDLIPLRYPEQYLDPYGTHDRYARALGFLRTAARVVAISESARQDAITMLGIEPRRVTRAWPVPDPVFRVLPPALLANYLQILRSHVRLPQHFILTVSHLHHTKNLATLLAAYARLPVATRTIVPLVVCCHLDPPGVKALQDLARDLGILDDLVLTGRVSDAELCALYNQATLLVHPSRFEGFGLPVVEAMACGAPVITTTASSLPEAAGDAALLVDPDDPAAFTAAMTSLLSDPAACVAMQARGFTSVARFSRRQLAETTLAAYRAAAEAPARRGPRIAMWTPLPPLETGVGDYAAELIEGLEARCCLEVFVDGGYLPEADLLQRHAIQHHSAFARRHREQPFDTVVYQVGASPFHRYMAAALTRHPGVVVLHDMIWSNVVYSAPQDSMRFAEELVRLHGSRALEEFATVDHDKPLELWDFLSRHPMLEPVIDASLAQIVHVPQAAEHLTARYPGTRPFVVPMGVADPYARGAGPADRLAACQQARQHLGVPAGQFVVGVFGIVHPLKKIASCISAVATLIDDGVDAALVVGGPIFDGEYVENLQALARELGVGGAVRFTDRLTTEAFTAHMLAADAVLNLRMAIQQHMSAVIMRSIAAGKPIVISDLAAWRVFPGTFSERIPDDHAEVAATAAHLRILASDAAVLAARSAAARDYFEQEATVDRMAERYLEVIAATHSSRIG